MGRIAASANAHPTKLRPENDPTRQKNARERHNRFAQTERQRNIHRSSHTFDPPSQTAPGGRIRLFAPVELAWDNPGMRPHPFLILALVGALIGFTFASVSTFDFAQHLDREVHGLHCSFVPGLGEGETTGSDCEVTLMSPYSSISRTTVWGGIPISLAAMGVFAFLLFFGFEIWFGRRQQDRNATGFYALAALLPTGTSAVMGFISLSELDAACKLCIGIYTGSTLGLIGSTGLFVSAMRSSKFARLAATRSSDDLDASDDGWSMGDGAELDEPLIAPRRTSIAAPPASAALLIGAFFIGCGFVGVPILAYVVNAPDHSTFIGKCGTLEKEPEADLLIAIGPQHGTPALEIFDPLCPACRGFEEHLALTPYHDKLARKAVLFPLDAECNWMLGESVHHGACAISEAIVCADGRADDVISWAFENQEKILAATKADSGAARRMVTNQFPDLDKCVGSPKAKQKVNRSLRWAVDNNLKILTPQVYVGGVRLCDEDVDLGLEFAMSRMLKE